MYTYFRSGSVKPKGWLLQQLRIQANGLSGHLDKMWPDVADSAWIGGKADGWERVPYWLDGFIPLAYLLEDADMIARADRYVHAILHNQQQDGWICPCTVRERSTYDIWALFLIGKVLALYCDFTDSAEARDGLYRAMRCAYALLREGEIRLFDWGKFRWFEAIIPLQYLYDTYKEEWIRDFARLLRENGADYFDFIDSWKTPLNQWTWHTHIVNIAMMLKAEAVCAKLFGEKYENKAETLWKVLEKYNGTAVGTFTGDECLSGIGNNQGTELCSVVELMYSCELLYAVSGKSIWAQRLEKVAFNALPATISDDMWTHQYDQMVNQIACVTFPGKPFFRTNGHISHLFGLDPNCGCCTANFSQGWPKLAMNAFLRSRDGVVCPLFLPAELRCTIGGAAVTICAETEYPFRHRCRYTVTVDRAVRFALKLRIPQWADTVCIDGESVKKTDSYTVRRLWSGTQTLTVELSAKPRLKSRPHGLKTVEYGPLVFALPIRAEYVMKEYVKDGFEHKFPYCDYELYGRSEWRYGFAGNEFEVCEQDGDEIPFSSQHPRLTVKTAVCRVRWDLADGYETVCDKKPVSARAVGAPQAVELIPYGCAKLRMTEMPAAK